MFVSDQLIDTVIREIEREINTPKEPHDPRILRKYTRRFGKLMESWFDGTTGPQDQDEAKALASRLKRLRDSTDPEKSHTWGDLHALVNSYITK